MNAILSNDDLRSLAPSIFASRPWEGMSDRYRLIPTHEILGVMGDQGFHPVKVSQSRVRIPGKQGFQRHMVRLRHVDHLAVDDHEEQPEVILFNAHDRSSAYKLFTGIVRFACENGLIIQSVDFGSFSIRHSGSRDLYQQVKDATSRIMDDVPTLMGRIADWKQIILPRSRQVELAEAAYTLKANPAIAPVQLLTSRRPEDDCDSDGNRDLWRSYQTIQENLMRGGLQGRNARGRRISTRPIRAVDSDLNLNRNLWQIAESFSVN